MRQLDSGIKVNYLMHNGRENGLTEHIMKQINELKPDIVILPDASSSDYEQHEELYNKGIDVICLDHHEVSDGESKFAVVVNPQLCPEDYPNLQLAGVGVTYKFLQALDNFYSVELADQFLDLVALGSVTDSVDLTSPETRYYVYKGFKNVVNPFLKQLIYKNASWTRGEIYPSVVGWNIAPTFNALIRVGSNEDKEDVFRAMLGEEEDYFNPRTKKTETLPEKATRLCTNAYAKQKRIRLKLVKELEQKIESENLNENAFIILQLDDFEPNLKGYIAGNLTGKYRKPVLIMTWRDEEDSYMGSLRGFENGIVKDVKTFLEKLNLFNYVSGHANAAGVSISKNNITKLNDMINEALEHDEESQIEVDFEIGSNELTTDLIDEVVELEKYWGKNCEEPLFAVKDVELRCADIEFKNTTKATFNGIELISFSVDERLQDLAEDNKLAVCDIIGTLGINRFLGRETPQLKIQEIIIKEVKDDNSDDFLLF